MVEVVAPPCEDPTPRSVVLSGDVMKDLLMAQQKGTRCTASTGGSENWSIYSGPEASKDLAGLDADVEEEEECTAHAYEKFQPKRPVRCSDCEQRARKGVEMFTCSHCDKVICWSCKSALDADDEDWMEVTLSQIEMQDLAQAVDEDCGEQEDNDAVSQDNDAVSQEASANTAASSLVPKEVERRRLSPAAAAAEMSSTQSAGTQGTTKSCSKCKDHYSGFGDVCGGCRKCGPGGVVHECQRCAGYFRGFSACCEDCSEAVAEEI